MKVESAVFAVFLIFLIPTSIVYWLLSKDPTGTAALGICACLAALMSGYLYMIARRMAPRAQDLPDAEVADGAGELGHFSPGSYWPFFIASSACLMILGLIFGTPLLLPGIAFLLFGVVGLLFEGYGKEEPILSE